MSLFFFIFLSVHQSWGLKVTYNEVHLPSGWFTSFTVIHPLIQSHNPVKSVQ